MEVIASVDGTNQEERGAPRRELLRGTAVRRGGCYRRGRGSFIRWGARDVDALPLMGWRSLRDMQELKRGVGRRATGPAKARRRKRSLCDEVKRTATSALLVVEDANCERVLGLDACSESLYPGTQY